MAVARMDPTREEHIINSTYPACSSLLQMPNAHGPAACSPIPFNSIPEAWQTDNASTGSHDWGMHYLADKVGERLDQWRIGDDDTCLDRVLECESDDEDRTPRQSFSNPRTTNVVSHALCEREEDQMDRRALDEYEQDHTEQRGLNEDEQDQLEQRALDEYERSLEAMVAGEELRGRRKDALLPPLAPSPFEDPFSDSMAADTDERRDSTAENKSKTDGTRPRNIERKPPLPRSGDVPNASPLSLSEAITRERDQKDNASISTTSSQRARLEYGYHKASGQWKPFQSKSTASLGFSSGQSVMGKLSSREAVSPTRKRRSSVRSSSETEGQTELPFYARIEALAQTKAPVQGELALPLKSILKQTHIEIDHENTDGGLP